MAWSEYDITKALIIIRRRIRAGQLVKPALRQYSKESGIPYATLHRWYYPRKGQRRRKSVRMISEQMKTPLKQKRKTDPSAVGIKSPKLMQAAELAMLERSIMEKLAEWHKGKNEEDLF